MKNEYWKDGAKLIDLKDGLVLIVRTDSGYDNAELVSPGYDEDVEIGIGDIFYSRLVNGEYSKPVGIGPEINTGATETCPYIAPDESYIIFTRFDQTNYKNTGIFISRRDESGKWLPAVMLRGGDRKSGGLSPRISPDGKYLFYVNGGMWWIPVPDMPGK